MRLLVLTLGALCAALSAAAQSTTVDVDVTLSTPSSSCTFTLNDDLDFGDVEKPTTGTGSVTIDAVTGARSSSGAVVSGTSTVGQIRLVGQHTTSYTVTRTFPSTLTRSNESLTFSGTWAESTTSNGGYVTISGSSFSGTAGGAGTTFSRYFRFGGEVGGIDWTDTDGDYTGAITASATCN